MEYNLQYGGRKEVHRQECLAQRYSPHRCTQQGKYGFIKDCIIHYENLNKYEIQRDGLIYSFCGQITNTIHDFCRRSVSTEVSMSIFSLDCCVGLIWERRL